MSKPIEIRIKKGTFYVSSKEDGGEGWNRQEFRNPQNPSETLIRYHKELGVEGEVVWVGFLEDKYKGDLFGMLIKGEEGTYSLKIPVFSSGKVEAIDQYLTSVIGAFENVNKGDKVTMFVNNKNKNKDGHLYRNVVTLDSEGKLIKSNFQFKDVPEWEEKVTVNALGREERKWDVTDFNNFYLEKAKAIVDRFASSKQEESEQKKSEQPKEKEAETVDELPF